jgi:hypothetical protein
MWPAGSCQFRTVVTGGAAAMSDLWSNVMPGPSFDPKTAVSYGKFVNAAYTMYTGLANTRPPPSADFPADYELAAWILMRDFIIMETDPVFYGFIANKKNDPTKLVVAIRGTDNPAEIWDDLNALGMQAFSVNGVQIGNVALGFGRIYETMQIVPVSTSTPMPPKDGGGISFGEQVAEFVKLHATAKLGAADSAASISVDITGHSLGSALATYYVMENATAQKIKNPAICTFASPKVGDSDFTGAFNKLDLTSWRIANVRDAVPNLPPWFLFTHVNTQQLIDSTGRASPGLICCHKLTTYLHVLDPQYPVDQDCQVVPAHLVSGETPEMAVKQGIRPAGV